MKHMINRWLEGHSIGHAFFAWSILAQLALVKIASTTRSDSADARCRLKMPLTATHNQPAYQQRCEPKKGDIKRKDCMIGILSPQKPQEVHV